MADANNAPDLGSDAALIAMCNRIAAIEAERTRILEGAGTDAEHDAKVDPLCAELYQLVDRCRAASPVTTAGLRAMASACMAMAPVDLEGHLAAEGGDAEKLAFNIVECIMNGQGGTLAEQSFSSIQVVCDSLAHLRRRQRELDKLALRAPAGAEKEALYAELGQFVDAIVDTQYRVLAIPAVTLEDAAQQVAIIISELEGVPEEVDTDRLRGAARSALAVVMRAGNLDPKRIGEGKWDPTVHGLGLMDVTTPTT